MSGGERRECGWSGVDEATCLKRGCCWDESDLSAKWCFMKKPPSKIRYCFSNNVLFTHRNEFPNLVNESLLKKTCIKRYG